MKTNNISVEKAVAKILVKIKAVTISSGKPFRFVSGIISPIYADNRLLMGYPLLRREITIYMASLLKEKGITPDIVAGTATAGIPPAAWLSELLVLPMIYVRSEKKQHGKGRQVEGVIKKGDNILLVEDLISTGKSSIAAIDAIREEGGKIDFCIAFVDYGLKEARQAYKKRKVKLLTLTNFETLVETAKEEKLIAPAQTQTVLAWNKDPWSWGKNINI